MAQMQPNGRRPFHDYMMERAENADCRTVCAWCGELVFEGVATDGNVAFMEHLAEEHPDKYPAIAKREAERRERVECLLESGRWYAANRGEAA
jgi:hypothetical protein